MKALWVIIAIPTFLYLFYRVIDKLVIIYSEKCDWPPECFEGNCGPEDCKTCPLNIGE